MATFKRFEDIDAWQKARQLANAVYQVTRTGNFAHDFALRDQVRRAAVSIISNIAEGYERGGNKEFLQFLSLARGSCGELRAQLYLASDQDYVSSQVSQSLLAQTTEIGRMIAGLMQYLQQTQIRGTKFR